MTEFDFARINRELAARAAARNVRLRPAKSFDSYFCTNYLPKTIEGYLYEANSLKHIKYYFNLDDKGLKLFIKRLIRKANKFLFLRNFESQSKFNNSLLQTNLLLCRQVKDLQKQIDALKKQQEQQQYILI